jgi:hypothetical protein
MLRTGRSLFFGVALALLVASCGTSTHPVSHSTTTSRRKEAAKTVLAGPKWQVVLKSNQFAYTSLSCPTANRCIAAGYGPLSNYGLDANPADMPYPEFGVISTTQDGGGHWSTTRMAHPIDAVACMSEVRCIAVEQGNLYNAQIGWSTWVTTDGGNTWTKEPNPGPGDVIALTCPASNHCVAISQVPVRGVGQIPPSSTSLGWVSNDGGASWVRSSNMNIQFPDAVSCPSPSWCMVVGAEPFMEQITGNPVQVSQDGGATWQTLPTSAWPPTVTGGRLMAVSCVAVDKCTVGGAIGSGASTWLTTTNGGLSWQEHVIDDPSAVGVGALDCPRPGLCVGLVDFESKYRLTAPPGLGEELVYLQGPSVLLARISPSLAPFGGYWSYGPGISCPAYPRCYAEMSGDMPGAPSVGTSGIKDWYILRSE